MDQGSSVSRRKFVAAAGYSLAIPASVLAIDWHEPVVQFKAKALDGEMISTDSVQGHVVLVQFWATWCPVCRADAPAVNTIVREFRDQGLVMLAVDVGESRRTVTQFLAQNPREGKIVLTEDTNLAARFSPRAFPHYVAINRSGGVSAEQRGGGGESHLRHLLHEAGLNTIDSGPSGELRSSPRPVTPLTGRP